RIGHPDGEKNDLSRRTRIARRIERLNQRRSNRSRCRVIDRRNVRAVLINPAGESQIRLSSHICDRHESRLAPRGAGREEQQRSREPEGKCLGCEEGLIKWCARNRRNANPPAPLDPEELLRNLVALLLGPFRALTCDGGGVGFAEPIEGFGSGGEKGAGL